MDSIIRPNNATMLAPESLHSMSGVCQTDGSAAPYVSSAVADKRTNENAFGDLSREVYCILGVPFDAMDMPVVLRHVAEAAKKLEPFFISTPNVNFLVRSQADAEFRETLLVSDLCVPDGKPVVWIARLMGIPIKRTVPGSDMFEALKAYDGFETPLRVFLFGSTEDVAAAAAARINSEAAGLRCVGWACPGFGEIDELGGDRFIDQIDGSGAHFLVAALGARKGQLWLYRNRHRLRIPVRAHLGATINFQAGTVKRAPKLMRNLGLEWLWRIKEEPKLFSRYARDGGALLAIFVTRLVPLAVAMRWLRWRERTNVGHFEISHSENDRSVTFTIYGYATARQAPAAIEYFARLLNGKRQFIVDLTNTHAIDARFFGLLLMLRKQLQNRGCGLTITGASGALKNSFKRNGVGQLLTISAANQH